MCQRCMVTFFFFNDTATTEIYTLSLHDALPILDATSAQLFEHLLRELAKQGKTILYISHVLEVVEKVCARVIVIHKDRKSTRLNSSHANISYAVFCLKKKNNNIVLS